MTVKLDAETLETLVAFHKDFKNRLEVTITTGLFTKRTSFNKAIKFCGKKILQYEKMLKNIKSLSNQISKN